MSQVAFVRWFDASFQLDECGTDELNPGIVMESAGIIAREDDSHLSLALDSCPDQGVWRRVLHVPKAYILDCQRFDVASVTSSSPSSPSVAERTPKQI